jgi:hypothetical protein
MMGLDSRCQRQEHTYNTASENNNLSPNQNCQECIQAAEKTTILYKQLNNEPRIWDDFVEKPYDDAEEPPLRKTTKKQKNHSREEALERAQMEAKKAQIKAERTAEAISLSATFSSDFSTKVSTMLTKKLRRFK